MQLLASRKDLSIIQVAQDIVRRSVIQTEVKSFTYHQKERKLNNPNTATIKNSNIVPQYSFCPNTLG